MLRTFFTSDSHFGHANIIRYCQRPFADADAMDRAMVDIWNSVVDPRDTVYHLGDFSMIKPDQIALLLNKLNGTKHLIRGNHDPVHSNQIKGWSSVQEMAKIHVEGKSLFLCHYPMREWPGMWNGTIHLYGHVHGNFQPQPGSMEVSADVWGGKPVQIADICDALEPFDPEVAKRHRADVLRLQKWE